jgi:predicted nucleotidyltransferase
MRVRGRGQSTRHDVVDFLITDGTNTTAIEVKAHSSPQKQTGILAEASLKQLAEYLGVKPPSAYRQLQQLTAAERIARVETPQGPRYAALPFLRCEWVDPVRGMHETWQSGQAVDWRFPLVSRVRDGKAQAFLYEWLDRAQARNLLPAYKSRFETQQGATSLQVIVYGSCARGDAGPNSDLDLLLFGNASKRVMDGLKDLAHEIALKGGRSPDVRFMDADTWDKAIPAFQQSITRDGKTVFSNDFDALFLERSSTRPHD